MERVEVECGHFDLDQSLPGTLTLFMHPVLAALGGAQ